MTKSPLLYAIFTLKVSDNCRSEVLQSIFSDIVLYDIQGSNIVLNISCRPERLLELTSSLLSKMSFSDILIFNIYFFFPTSGFKVFNIKLEIIEEINTEDFDQFKFHVAQYILV